MKRAASCSQDVDSDVDALVCRIGLAHGIAIDGEHPCQPFTEESVVVVGASPDDVILHSVGPLQGLDRLAGDQVLKFALDGITIVFGDNGSGKSGYTRALRQLTCVREDAPLESDVFAAGNVPSKSITYAYRVGKVDAVTATWTEGDPKPAVLGGVTLLDTDNLRVYVNGKSDILYMPPEAACVGRLADLYQAAASRYRGWIDDVSRRCAGAFGGYYAQGTSAAALIARLQEGTPEANLPTEHALRDAATWSPDDEAELASLQAELVRGPAATAALCDRIASSCLTVATAVEATATPLSDDVAAGDKPLVEARQRTRRVADALAAEQIGSQPVGATGSDTWRELFAIARRFAAEAGVRTNGEPFAVGDPCPLCQQTLGEDAAVRLAAFDAYVEGQATREAELAAGATAQRISALRNLSFKAEGELRMLLAEAATHGAPAQAMVDRTAAFSAGLEARRDERVRQFNDGGIADLEPLPASPLIELRTWAAQLSEHATTLRSGDDRTAAATARIAELTDRRQMSGQVEELVARRKELKSIHMWKRCEAALNTGPLSRLMTSLRKELTTPGLRTRIEEEIRNFALTHIPFHFSDETSKGTSFFEVALATTRKAKKARVLSEGEQRALSLACFLAESHVAGRSSGILLDDPVTSLDHGRVRRVARRLVDEAAKGRQIVVFTHNLVFYHELTLACVDRAVPVPALPCLIQQGGSGEFGIVTVGDAPWVARKVKEREQTLKAMIDDIPDDLAVSTDDYGRRCTGFYAALRETWERAVEEIVLNDVVRRFGPNVGTLRLGGVNVSDDDFLIVHRAMSRASERSGHDQAAGRQVDTPIKAQMRADLAELTSFRTAKTKSNKEADDRRKSLATAPPRAAVV
ncbi:AAA family ATPase [Sphingomonas sp. CFBP 13720]|uniref:AAA family ATPase n=1 Tax=Sphingomonas sp. CFBP 13720 TaxID=2775302 RepID=UPI001783DA31|nr:AAA family ATPase [Sphingomonas sp. CFBP 13720]MBD8678320.1 AAA family ATPase [Sphingomonas sp. CFBP 13720]